MKEKVSYLGKRFTRWIVTGRNFDKVPSGSTHIFYNCICDCGNVSVVNKQSLTTGKSKSCGCLRDEKLSRRSSNDVHQIKVVEKSSKKVLVEIDVNVDMSFINKLDNLKSLESRKRDEMMKKLMRKTLIDPVDIQAEVDNFCPLSVTENYNIFNPMDASL